MDDVCTTELTPKYMCAANAGSTLLPYPPNPDRLQFTQPITRRRAFTLTLTLVAIWDATIWHPTISDGSIWDPTIWDPTIWSAPRSACRSR